jgi:hypothetical protein
MPAIKLIVVFRPVNGAGTVKPWLLRGVQGRIFGKAKARALLGLFVPEIAALVNAIAQMGDGTNAAVIRHKKPPAILTEPRAA